MLPLADIKLEFLNFDIGTVMNTHVWSPVVPPLGIYFFILNKFSPPEGGNLEGTLIHL